MTPLDQIGGLVQQYSGTNTNVSHDQAQNDYDTIASAVPKDILESRSVIPGPGEERMGNSASEVTPALRG